MICGLIIAGFLALVKGDPPDISYTPKLYIGQDETGRHRLLDELSVSDPDGDPFTCFVEDIRSKSDPGLNGQGCNNNKPCANGDEFTLTRNPLFSDVYNFKLAPGDVPPVLEENDYEVSITCRDTNNEETSIVVLVEILENEDVWWDDGGDPNRPNKLPYRPATPLDAKTTVSGTELGQVQASTNGSAITKYEIYRVSPDLPTSGSSYFKIDNSGLITTKKDFYTISHEYGQSFHLDIKATDANNKLSIYGRFTVPLTNQNHRPRTYVLPFSDVVSEFTPVGHTFFSLNEWNPEPDQIVTATDWSCDPATGNTLFNLEYPGNNFVLHSPLDYDGGETTYTCDFRLYDGFHYSLDTYTYTLTVTNENDAPVLAHDTYYATFSEGKAFTETVDPLLDCTDVEGSVTYALEDSGNSSRYRINANTGELTLAANHDLEGDDPVKDSLVVYCTDQGDITGAKLTDTATIVVAINDANDNSPGFPSRGYTWFSDNTMEPGYTVIGTLSPNDSDSWSINNNYKCSWTSPSAPALTDYYSGSETCQLFLRKTMDLPPGTHVKFIATVQDLGNPSLSSTTTVDVINQDLTTTTITTTTTSTEAYNFWDETGSVISFALTMAGLAGLLGTGLYVLLRGWLYGWDNLWPRCTSCRYRKYPAKQVNPVTPPRTPPQRENTPVIHEKPTTPVVVKKPEPILVKRTILRPRLQPAPAPILPLQATQLLRGPPPSLLSGVPPNQPPAFQRGPPPSLLRPGL